MVFRRLDTRALVLEVLAEAKDCLYLLHVGFGVKCGADAAVHEARCFLADFWHEPTYILSSMDTDKSFN